MRRVLVLLRHAEAAMPSGADRDRPLTARGREQARSVAAQLREASLVPSLLVHSAATRAVETADGLLAVFPGIERMSEETLYLADLDAVADCAWGWPEQASVVVVVGHNPGWSMAVAALGGPPVSLGTACGAAFAYETENWGEALLDRGSYLLGLRPG